MAIGAGADVFEEHHGVWLHVGFRRGELSAVDGEFQRLREIHDVGAEPEGGLGGGGFGGEAVVGQDLALDARRAGAAAGWT